MDEKPVLLSYWDIRGRAEPLRLLMEFLDVPYEQNLYKDVSAWQIEKSSVPHPFPNLPYLVDGDKVVCESEAIAYHIALKVKRYDLLGKSPEDVVFLRTVKGVVTDLSNDVLQYCFNPEAESIVHKFLNDKVHPRLERFDSFLKTNEYLIGSYITFIDFVFFELIAMLLAAFDNVLEKYPSLRAYRDRIAQIPKIEAYYQSPRFPTRSFLPPSAAVKI
eukprot:TRINITY_DN3916_c0_g1_i3.p1 TRINITY_DN3916_c0_g1~~TRINITY_DN3916_c0_g1_i3.p1  ORF type:complete len:218 (+),score=54.31 TRINITY_DN3916_c0_g1_i3:38-691(+)